MRRSILLLTGVTIYSGACFACTHDVQAVAPQSVEQQYGLRGAYSETVATADGSLSGTVVPVTLADGRSVPLFIPAKTAKEPHAVYVRDNAGLRPVNVKAQATREEVVGAAAGEVGGLLDDVITRDKK